MKLEGPNTIEDEEDNHYRCSITTSSPDIQLKWKINGKTGDGVDNIISDQEDNSTLTIESEIVLKPGDSNTVKLVCFVEGHALQFHRQKIVSVLGVKSKTKEEVWRVVERGTTEEEFLVPDGFTLVDINEDNYRDYVSRIKHLLTEEVGEKMVAKLVGFVVSLPGEEGGGCDDGELQCCPDQVHPQHGSNGYGCCASSEHGCCPDNITPAPAPFFDVSYVKILVEPLMGTDV